MTPIFYIKEGNLSFADKQVLKDLELYISSCDKICLVGRNGSGKSSLMKIINGEYELDSGEIFKDPVINVGYLKQDMKIIPTGIIYDFVLSGLKEDNKYQADIILNQLDIDGKDDISNCSGGQLRRVFLAKALISNPEILLLDEPTNHLDISTIEWLEKYINDYPGAVICISHDRAFQENISNKVWWIDRGVLRKSSRGFRYYDQWYEEVITQEEAVLRKMNRKLEAEKDWFNAGVTARRKRNQKRLANLHRLRESFKVHQFHLTQAKSKLQVELTQEVKKSQFIIETDNISYNFPNKKLFNNFTFKVNKGEKIGIIGPNGVGKTTFIRLLTKDIEPEEGKVKHGTNLDITYFDQYRTELNDNHTLKQILCPNGGDHVFLHNKIIHVAGYLKNFMFNPKILNNKVSTLSGGEANRLLLAKALINPGNFLILDEPTNDLDMDSLEILLDILADYSGTLLVVSHDRDFLERLVTRTLIFTGEEVIDIYGGYQDYLKYYKKDVVTEKIDKRKNTLVDEKKILKPQKLSYKYARLLETLPVEIEQLEHKIQLTEQELSKADLYTNNFNKFMQLSQELEKDKVLLEEKLSLWIEVENLNKSIEK